MYKSWIALAVGESRLFDPSFRLLAPCRHDKRDLWDSVLLTTDRQTDLEPYGRYQCFVEALL